MFSQLGCAAVPGFDLLYSEVPIRGLDVRPRMEHLHRAGVFRWDPEETVRVVALDGTCLIIQAQDRGRIVLHDAAGFGPFAVY